MKRKIASIALVTIGALLSLASCQLIGVNQDARLSNFFKQAYNNQQSDLYTNFSSTATTEYSQIKSATFWNGTPFGPNAGPILGSYPSPISGTSVSGTFTSEGVSFTFSATFVQSGMDWYFATFSWTDATNNTYTIKVIR